MAIVELLRLEGGSTPGSFLLIGELDISNVPEVTERLGEELRRVGSLTLDATDLRFMDSQGLRMLIRLGMEAAEHGTAVSVINCSSQVKRLLEISIPSGIPGVNIVQADA